MTYIAAKVIVIIYCGFENHLNILYNSIAGVVDLGREWYTREMIGGRNQFWEDMWKIIDDSQIYIADFFARMTDIRRR